jgi:NitT/TauT family transport system ATP-binding protein
MLQSLLVADHGRTGSIVLERVTQRFPVPREEREFTAVQDVSVDVRGGEFVSIVGPSGCGKSTLLSLIAGLVPISAGRITIDGEPVAGVNPRLGFVFQRDAIFPWKTVAQNVGLPLLFRGVDSASAAAACRRMDRADRAHRLRAATTRTSSPAACVSASRWR